MPKKPKTTPIGPVARCIFCGSPELTGEDLWPLWLSMKYPLAPGLAFGHHPWSLSTGPGFSSYPQWVRKKLHIVCGKTCNSGWMSELENAAKPFLLPLIQHGDKPYAFTEEGTATLVRWMVKMAMVWEYSQTLKPCVFYGPQRCGVFGASKGNVMPPDVDVRIWLGQRRGRVEGATFANVNIRKFAALVHPVPSCPELWSFERFVMVTTFAIDRLLFQVVSERGSGPRFPVQKYDAPGVLFRLWPTPARLHPWPTLAVLEDHHLGPLSSRFDRVGWAEA